MNSNSIYIKYDSKKYINKEDLFNFFKNEKYNIKSLKNKKEVQKIKCYEKISKNKINNNKTFEEIKNLKSIIKQKDVEMQGLKDENNELKNIIKKYKLNKKKI